MATWQQLLATQMWRCGKKAGWSVSCLIRAMATFTLLLNAQMWLCRRRRILTEAIHTWQYHVATPAGPPGVELWQALYNKVLLLRAMATCHQLLVRTPDVALWQKVMMECPLIRAMATCAAEHPDVACHDAGFPQKHILHMGQAGFSAKAYLAHGSSLLAWLDIRTPESLWKRAMTSS
jgi:hypothetical protein